MPSPPKPGSDFDPIRAQIDIVAGLSDICGTLKRQMQQATTRFAVAEAEMNAIIKLLAFAEVHHEQAAERLAALRKAKEEQENPK